MKLITSAVIVQTTTVSMNGSNKATMPFTVAGYFVLTAECAMAADPDSSFVAKRSTLKSDYQTHLAHLPIFLEQLNLAPSRDYQSQMLDPTLTDIHSQK